jgi:hypothetical protein
MKSGEDVSIGFDWAPTMMANASRDPYWQAGVRREVIDHSGARAAIEGECAICHMPMSTSEAKASGHEGEVFKHLAFLSDNREDQLAADGVSCALCHQINKEKLGTKDSFIGGFVLGGPTPQGERLTFGPYHAGSGLSRVMSSSTGGFKPAESAHIQQSEVCATCHTLYTRALVADAKEHDELPEQVPYQEWLHSSYRGKRSCQSCHMPEIPEDVFISSVMGVPRQGASRHVFVGGNFLMQRVLNRFRAELSVKSLSQEQAAASERTLSFLQLKTAQVSISKPEVRGGRLEIEVSVENLGGHKLPTAYPSRRAWLHVAVHDKDGRTVFESGAVKADGAIQGNDNDLAAARFEPHYTEVRLPEQVQIYETIMGDSAGQVTTGLLTGVQYLKDNRLLPRGFDKRTAASDIAVRGEASGDADFTAGVDKVRYSIDLGGAQGPFRVEAELCYQPIGYRWAMNLKGYNSEESKRFGRYFEDVAPASFAVLAKARVE